MHILRASTVYVLSDLHIVGEGVKDPFVCERELIEFLGEVRQDDNAMVLFLGDVFDFWQMEGPPAERLRRIIAKHALLFKTIHELSGGHPVKFLPGNHDREAAWDEDVRKILAEYGIETIDDEQILAEVKPTDSDALVRILAEHGHAGDPYNQYAYDPHPAERTFGEHLMRIFINPIKKMEIGREESWLRDIDNVHPLAAVPWWVASKYFYIEAGFWLKALALPAMVLFGITKIGLLLLALQFFGVNLAAWGLPHIPKPLVYTLVGLMGIDAFALALLFVIWGIRRDCLRTLRRWGYEDLDMVVRERQIRIEKRVRHALRESGADLYIFGHTHEESLRMLPGGRVLCNAGTWMKRMHRMKAHFHMPPVFVPGFRLTYVRISPTGKGAKVELHARRKDFAPPLTYLERFALWGRPLPWEPKQTDTLLECMEVLPAGRAPVPCECHEKAPTEAAAN